MLCPYFGSLNRDPEEIKEEQSSHEYASPQKIKAMSAALYNTLRKKKKKKPPPEVRKQAAVCACSLLVFLPPVCVGMIMIIEGARAATGCAQPSWRDNFDEDGNRKTDPWWARTDDPFEDQAFLDKYFCSN